MIQSTFHSTILESYNKSFGVSAHDSPTSVEGVSLSSCTLQKTKYIPGKHAVTQMDDLRDSFDN